FLNFYLSTGLCLWAISLLWRPTLGKALISVPLIVLAMLAHALPVAWMGAALAYVHASRRIPAKLRLAMLLAGAAAILAVQVAIVRFLPVRWSFPGVSLNGLFGLTGAEQLWLFGGKYLVVAIGIAIIWCVLFLERLDQRGMLADPMVHL